MTTYSTDSQGKFIPATQRPDGTWRKPRRVRDGYVPQEEVPLYESKGKQFAQKPALPPGLSLEVVQKAKEKRDRERIKQQQREEQQKKEQNGKRAQNATGHGVIAADGSGGNGDKQKTTAPSAKNASVAAGRSKKTPELPDILQDHRPATKPKQQPPKSAQQKPDPSSSSDATNAVAELANTLASGAQLKDQPAEGPDGQQLELAKKLRKLRKKIREIEAIEVKLRSADGTKLDKDQLEKVKRKPEILQEIEELEVQYSAGAM